MGEIADDTIAGRCCAICSCYFNNGNCDAYEHGYPVVCKECHEDGLGEGYPVAQVETF